MKIFAYCNFVNPLQIPPSQEVRLMNLWRESWSNLGFEPIVLNEYYARQHAYYAEYDRLVSAFPSVNPAKYDRACFIRWLAAANAPVHMSDLFLISDYDVMGYHAEPFLHYGKRVIKVRPPAKRLVFYEKYCPSLVLGHRQTFEQQARRFAEYKLEADDLHDTTPHISDQNILAKMQTRMPDHYEVLHLVRSYGETGWDTAPAVHFCNAAMGPPKAQFQPRHQFIRQLRPF